MWPILLDMTKEECKRTLRRLELEAYGGLVSALRAQGGLCSQKHKLLKDLGSTLNIPQERHRAEVRRAVNDERLATIAHCMTGDDTTDEWALEGRRLVPLMPRLVPQSAYSIIADEEANKSSIDNEKLPLPTHTERKRTFPSNNPENVNKNVHFRVPNEPIKATVQNNNEDLNTKKRKPNLNMESSSLAQHLMMGQPKISRVQQLYRQRTKALLKSQMKHQRSSPAVQAHHNPAHINSSHLNPAHASPHLKPPKADEELVPEPQKPQVLESKLLTPSSTNLENLQPKPKLVQKMQGPAQLQTDPSEKKSIKICPARKVITTTSRNSAQSQKVIIVSSAQGTTSPSILQRTLTIPFVKTISMKNLDKVKVLNNLQTNNTNVVSSGNCQKPKLLTVQTKSKIGGAVPPKHLSIPFIQGVQLQALQKQGAIKMLPLNTGKGAPKSTIITTTSGSVYIMNSNHSIPAVTASNHPPITTSKPLNEPQSNIYILKNEEVKSALPFINTEPTENICKKGFDNIVQKNTEQFVSKKPEQFVTKPDSVDSFHRQKFVAEPVISPKLDKSPVLADILKASGVLSTEADHDIESQITQLTQIPGASSETEVTQRRDGNGHLPLTGADMMQDEETIVEQTIETDNGNYVILQENEIEIETLNFDDDLVGSLDPETGMYSMDAPQEEYEIIEECEHNQTLDETYVIDMGSLQSDPNPNGELDLPNL